MTATATAPGVSGPATLVRTVGATLRGRDLSVVAAGLTYFSGIAVVPWLLLSVWTATLVSSPQFVLAHAADLRLLVPPQMGGVPVYDRLVAAGIGLGPLGAVVALFPASFYGEGLRRACLRLVPRTERLTGWRARAVLLPLVLAAPVLMLGVLIGSPLMAELTLQGGFLGTLGRIFVSFNITWIVVGVVLVWAFRVVAPGAPGGLATVLGAFGTSAILSGFLQGFLLFLAIRSRGSRR